MTTQTARFDAPLAGATGSVPGFHGANPYMLPQLMEAARNCVQEFCQVKPGERVLVVAEFDTEPLVVSAMAAAAKLLGAEVAMMTVNPLSAGGYEPGNPSEMLMGAFERADVVIACTYFEIAHAHKTFFGNIFGSARRVCSILMASSPGSLVTGGRFPVDLFMAIGERAMRTLEGCKELRYTTALGTDITFEGLQGLSFGDRLTRGTWGIFPQMGVNFYPANSNGVIVIEDSTITGRPLAPIKLTIKDNYLVGVEAGAAADAANLDAFSNGRYYLRHAVVGLNPKARLVNAPQFERERAAGTVYLGIDGVGEAGAIDRTKPGYAHLDMVFDTPSVYVDGRLMVDRRRLLLLEDPELHALAAKWGDPRRVLAQNPFLW